MQTIKKHSTEKIYRDDLYLDILNRKKHYISIDENTLQKIIVI